MGLQPPPDYPADLAIERSVLFTSKNCSRDFTPEGVVARNVDQPHVQQSLQTSIPRSKHSRPSHFRETDKIVLGHCSREMLFYGNLLLHRTPRKNMRSNPNASIFFQILHCSDASNALFASPEPSNLIMHERITEFKCCHVLWYTFSSPMNS